MKKSCKKVVDQRVELVSKMMIDGQGRADIIHFSSDNWNISERQIDKYIAKAREVIQNDIIRNIEFDYAKSIKRYECIYQKAIQSKDFKLALLVNKEISSLQGLNKVQMVHTGTIEFISNIPD